MAAAAPGADFKLVLHGVGAEQRSAIIAELMAVFQIDQATAASATENVPIVLVGGMTQPQALCLRTHIARLVKLGADLKLTSEQVGKVKQLRWQAPPAATRVPANLFVCPSCGERFVVQRWQAAAAAPAAPVPAAAPAPGAAPLEAEPLEAEPVDEALPAEEIDFAEELAALPAEEPAAEAPAEVAEAEAIAESEPLEAEAIDEEEDLLGAFAEEAEGPEPEPVAPEPPPQPAQPPPPSVPKPTVPRPAPAAPPLLKPIAAPPQEPPSPPQPAAAPKPPPQPAPQPKPPAPAPPSAQPEPEEPAGPRYDVSAAKVRGDKLDKLAELVAQRQGITFEEALRSCEKTVVVVCRGGTSAEADECRKELLAIGIKPRIRKRGG